jgi:hypothetical protein
VGDLTSVSESIDHLKTTIPSTLKGASQAAQVAYNIHHGINQQVINQHQLKAQINLEADVFNPKNGSFEVGDKPLQISKAHMEAGRLFLTVQWQQRPANKELGLPATTPAETLFSNTELKRYCPLILCEYYEKLLKVNIKGHQVQSDCLSVTSAEREYINETE